MKKTLLTNILIFISLCTQASSQQAPEENPIDRTSYIVNPSFEDNTNGWASELLATQTNAEFKRKAGNVYLEKWTGSGAVGDGYAKQTITNLPLGVYQLTAGAQNYTQSSTSKKNTGAYIFAGDEKETIYTPNDYTVTFTNITGDVEIGFIANKASGNWIAVDNFRLYQIGELSTEDMLAEVEKIIDEIEGRETANSMMSNTAATALKNALDNAKQLNTNSAEEEFRKAMKNISSPPEFIRKNRR